MITIERVRMRCLRMDSYRLGTRSMKHDSLKKQRGFVQQYAFRFSDNVFFTVLFYELYFHGWL